MESSTEILRRMLDERGADYRVSATGYSIDIGPYTTAYANRSDTTLDVSLRQVTPEQAIAATLGSCNCTNDCTNSERTDAPRLPHFWTHDGTLHIEATRMPTRIVVCEGGTCEFVPKRELDASEAENANLRELLQASLRDFRRIYDHDEQDGWQMVDAIDRMVIGMRDLGIDVGRTEQELRIGVDDG